MNGNIPRQPGVWVFLRKEDAMIKGNLYERNGIYYAVISYYENGKRKQKSVSTKLPGQGEQKKSNGVFGGVEAGI